MKYNSIIKMQYCYVAIKGCSQSFWQMTRRICNAFSRAKAWSDNEAADAFLFEYGKKCDGQPISSAPIKPPG